MSIIKINGGVINLSSEDSSIIYIDDRPDVVIEEGDPAILKRILFMGFPTGFKGYDNVSLKQLSRIKNKFRVSNAQAVVYNIIEKINFYDHLVILTAGIDYAGIEYLSEIKRFFEFSGKKIFILVFKRTEVPFQV
jgi:hypothetical protein